MTTLTRAHLCDALTANAKLSRQQAVEVLEGVLQDIADGLKREGQVKISSFGTFHVREKGARIGRNPKTGQEVEITPRKSLSFRASQILKEQVA